MSARSRHAKADARRDARWAERRTQLAAAQSGLPPFSELAVALAFDVDPARLGFFCDGEAVARRWCRDHPQPMPHGLGAKYRARRGRSW